MRWLQVFSFAFALASLAAFSAEARELGEDAVSHSSDWPIAIGLVVVLGALTLFGIALDRNTEPKEHGL